MDNDGKAQKFSSPLDFIYQARDPKKRQIKPVDRHLELLELAASIEAGDSSDDEEYVPKNINVNGDDEDDDDEDDAVSDDDNSDEDDEDEEDEDEDEEDDGEDEEEENDVNDTKLNVKIEKKHSPNTINNSPTCTSPSKMNLSKSPNTNCKSPTLDVSSNQLKICSVCLGDESRGDDEIVECDSCGIPVHETCYGIVSEDDEIQSVHSNVSSESTEPWFCEPCRRGVKSPNCDLCPNSGGIFKETDRGRWVHAACALYTHGVSFADVERLSGVTLFELNYSLWGAKACTICEDRRLAKTGICIGCDAGLCKTYFHVTCAQKEGLLSESSRADDIDPFIAHCKMHSDKQVMKKKRRTCLALQAKLRKIPTDRLYVNTERTRKRLEECISRKQHTLANVVERPPLPYKVSRMLMTSPSVITRLTRKSELFGLEPTSAFMSIADEMEAARRKWHIPPGFNLEFVAYVLDRTSRLAAMKKRNSELLTQNTQLTNLESQLRANYDDLMCQVELLRKQRDNLIQQAKTKFQLANQITMPQQIADIIQRAPRDDVVRTSNKQFSVNIRAPTVASSAGKKAGTSNKDNNRHPSFFSNCGGHYPMKNSLSNEITIPEITNHTCGLCKQSKDQHLMSLCDTCHLYLHIYCLDPPLARVPKKTKFGGWQCSDCAEKDNEEQEEAVEEKNSLVSKEPDVPRRLRNRISAPDKYTPEGVLYSDFYHTHSSGRSSSSKVKKYKSKSTKKSTSTNSTVASNTSSNININSFDNISSSSDLSHRMSN